MNEIESVGNVLYLFKVGLEEIEKLENDTKWCEKLTLETWNWKVMKNIWSVEHFFVL